MSLDLVSRVFSAFTRSSTCLRCCKTPWAFSWSCQKFGSLTFSSRAASCFLAESASKKAPHELNTFLELGVALLQVFDVFSHSFSPFYFGDKNKSKPAPFKKRRMRHPENQQPKLDSYFITGRISRLVA